MNASVKMRKTNPPWDSGLTPATQRGDNLFLHRFLPLKTLVFSQYSAPVRVKYLNNIYIYIYIAFKPSQKISSKGEKTERKKKHDLLNILYNKNYNLKFNFLLTINKPKYISEQDFSLPL